MNEKQRNYNDKTVLYFFRILLASGVNAKVMLKFVVKIVTSFEKVFKTALINEMCYLHSCKLFSSHLYFTRDVRRPFNEWININGGFRGVLPWSIIFLLPTLRVALPEVLDPPRTSEDYVCFASDVSRTLVILCEVHITIWNIETASVNLLIKFTDSVKVSHSHSDKFGGKCFNYVTGWGVGHFSCVFLARNCRNNINSVIFSSPAFSRQKCMQWSRADHAHHPNARPISKKASHALSC